MSIYTQFQDIKISLHKEEKIPCIKETVVSERIINYQDIDNPILLKLVERDVNSKTLSYHYSELKTFNPKFPDTNQSFLTILKFAESIAELLKDLHRRNLSIGLMSFERFSLDTEGDFKILGNTLISEHYNSLPFSRLANKDFYFLPPECYENNSLIPDYRADFYVLGILLYRWFTGKLPFFEEDKLVLMHKHLTQVPTAPFKINEKISKPLNNIILNLLEKHPSKRYNSAYGILRDIDRIKQDYLNNKASNFGLSITYNPGRINFGNILYGREQIIQDLKYEYNQISLKQSQIVFIEGFSGVGKTSAITHFLNGITDPRTIFLNGKFDQYKQTPYSGIQMAFRDLEKQVLIKSKINSNEIKDALSKELGKNASVLLEVIPSISIFTETFEIIEELNPIESRNRFNFLFFKFCKVLTDFGLKLIFFIDDWQWCDQPSLQLIQALIQQRTNGILFLFAYRNNEVGTKHPFALFKMEIEKFSNYRLLTINPLSIETTNKMLSGTLEMQEELTKPFSKIVHQKTEGNPFYIKQFVFSLTQKGLLVFDGNTNTWQWEILKLIEEELSENVVDLITKNLNKLSFETQIIFKIAAFVGGRFDIGLISKISAINKVSVGVLLDVALSSSYISRYTIQDRVEYKFVHDRMQQAAYKLNIPSFSISTEQLHYKIGLSFLNEWEDSIYSEREILSHFLVAKTLIAKHEAAKIIEMTITVINNPNLAITPEATINYLNLGLYLNNKFGVVNSNFKLLFGLSESHFLINKSDEAEYWAEKALNATTNEIEKTEVYVMKMLFYESYAMFEKNIETGLMALKVLNIDSKKHYENKTLEALIQDEFELFNKLTSKNYLEELSNKKMEEAKALAIMDVLVNMNASAYFVDLYLFAWSTIKMSNQTLLFGLTNSTPFAFVFMGSLLVAFYKEFDRGYVFGKSGVDLLKYVDSNQYKCRTLSIFPIFIQHFNEPIRNSLFNLDESIYSGLETGDLPYAGYSFYAKVRDAFLSGDNIKNVLKLCEESIAFMESINNLGLLALMKLLKGSLLKLEGIYTKEYASIEKEALQFLLEVKFYTAVSHHYIFRSWVHCIYKEYGDAQKLLKSNEEIIIYAASQPHVPKHFFLDSLCIFYLNGELTETHYERIQSNQENLLGWSNSMPENFAAEYHLIETLLIAHKGDIEKSLTKFNDALHWAEKGQLLGVKAHAFEVVSDMLKSRGFDVLAESFFDSSQLTYKKWGADGKLVVSNEIFDKNYQVSQNHLDLNTSSLIKAMQAISSEVDKSNAIKKLLTILMENAGADRSTLILIENGNPIIEAEFELDNENQVFNRIHYGKHKNLPKLIIDFVINTKTEFVLDELTPIEQLNESYIKNSKVKSLLALPLIRQQDLLGVLYLENHQFEDLFKGNDLEILKIIASQAAISIYNTLLFKETTDLNIDLQASKEELSKMNLLLEDKIKDRTKVLRQEIETRKQVEIELKKAQKEAEKYHQQQIKLERRDALQSKMMMLSSQMNPHFIFNSLGSVQSYIINNESLKAVDFISEFAGLMRKNLINSTTKYISIAEEIEFLDKYLLLEKIRFNNSFDYDIIEKINNVYDTLVPPMLLQPFIENAIIHGLSRLKDRKGKLKVELKENTDFITCTITDNGIGRKNALKNKSTGHKSVAISNLETRIELLNSNSEENEYTYEIIDLYKNKESIGTKVIVKFPNDLH